MQTILLYGGSTAGKTTQASAFAEYQFRMLGVPVLYIGSDSGWASAGDAVLSGAMIPYNLASAKTVLFTLRRLARGQWPSDLKRVSGQTVNMRQVVGEWITDGFSLGTNDVMKPIEQLFPVGPKGYRIGGIIIEGLTRNAQLLAGTLTNEMQQDTGQPLVSKFKIKSDGTVVQGPALVTSPDQDDEESYAMNSQGTYSAVQQWTIEYVNRFKGHPHCPRLLVTAHQGEGKNQGLRCLGPVIMGNALVGDAPGWFDSYFHCEPIPVGSFGPNSPEMRALWYQSHPDRNGSSGLMWPTKLGATPRITAWFRQNYPGGFIPASINDKGELGGGLRPFLEATGNV